MKTDYQNINSFEMATVGVAVLGVVLLGWEVYATMPAQMQHQVSKSFVVFDLRDEGRLVSSLTQFTYGSVEEFYHQFDIAFTQTFSFPDEIGVPAMKIADGFSSYADMVAANYEYNNSIQNNSNAAFVEAAFIHPSTTLARDNFTGTVSGASTTSADNGDNSLHLPRKPLIMPYQYVPLFK